MTEKRAVEILSRNIGELTERIERAQEQRAICMRELIDRLLRSAEAEDAEALCRRCFAEMPSTDRLDQAMLCAAMATHPHTASLLPRRGFATGMEETAAGAHGKVAMVRNRYNELAFERFSSAITGAKRSYVSSFSEACEDVYDNRCEFCVLPIENESDGRLFGFYAMLDRYELKIVSVCALESEERGERVIYALAGRKLPDRLPKELLWYLEFSLVFETGSVAEDVLRVAPLFSAVPGKLDSLPVGYDDGMQRFYCRFRMSREMAAAMELYLFCEHAEYSCIGMYPMMGNNK